MREKRDQLGIINGTWPANLLSHLLCLEKEIVVADKEKSGYMSPEYAIDGHLSVKSDVFNFGVLVLEIVSGKRNRGFFHLDYNLNLLGHAWMVYKEGKSLDLLDEAVRDFCHVSEVLRSIHVGLLCVQQSPKDRPTMSSVVLMLGGEGALPCPKQPGFFTERNLTKADNFSGRNAPTSTNEFTITILEPR
ncbi:hypothetical protein TEA_007247 [Camellia sinensis var. sinensis]|uniref:Protein kinase domain-containing protein n=2 Tax=Camellia sinensis TaxID=4442 RepID=A0A4S4EQ85_CAMSN|nr:hypothetical protein TEA_007247 [Camellia sinensis var. sinensis]